MNAQAPRRPKAREATKRTTRTAAARKAPARREDPLLDGEAFLGQAETVVAKALSRGADQAEVYWESGTDLDVEIEKGQVHNTGTGRGSGGSVRVVKGRRVGFAYFTTEKEALPAIESALQNTRLAPDKGYSLPGGSKVRAMARRWHGDVAALDLDWAIAAAQELIEGASEACPGAVVSGGGVSLSAGTSAIASSEGIAVWDRETMASVDGSLVLTDGARSVTAGEGESSHSLGLDARRIGGVAGERVASLRKPRPVAKGGRFDIVLRPSAAGEILGGLAIGAANGDEAMKGKTVWSKKLGESVASRKLSILDDARHPEAIGGVPFDDEGLATYALPILERGVLRNYLFDSWDANEHGQKSTHSAVRGGFKSRPETGAHHTVIQSTAPSSLDKLIAGIDDGFLVDQVLGAHTANVTTGEFSVTSPGVWRIRKGEVAGAVTEIAIAGNLDGMLRAFDGASREVKRSEGSIVPFMRFRSVSVSV